MKAKTMRPAAKRTAAVLMAALLAVTALLGALNSGQTAYAAHANTAAANRQSAIMVHVPCRRDG